MKSVTCNANSNFRLGLWVGILFALSAALTRCSRAASQQADTSLGLRSSLSGDTIPRTCSSCDHQDGASSELSWSAPPEHTQSFALIVFDKYSPFAFKFTHWLLYDTSSDKRELPENASKQEQLPDGSRQGQNNYDRIVYVAPVSTKGDSSLRFYSMRPRYKAKSATWSSKKQVVKAMNGHVLASGELVSRFQH